MVVRLRPKREDSGFGICGIPVRCGLKTIEVILRATDPLNDDNRPPQPVQSDVLRGINRILQKALTCKTEAELGRLCLSAAEELTSSRCGLIGWLNAEGGLDPIESSAPEWRGRLSDPFDPWVRRVMVDAEGYFTNAPAGDTGCIDGPQGHRAWQTFLGVPLRHAGKTIGLLAVVDREGGYRHVDRLALASLAPTVVQALLAKRAEQELQESNQRYKELVQYANSVILRWKSDGTITFINEYAQALFGYHYTEVLGRNVGLLVPHRESTGGDLSGLVEDIVAHPVKHQKVINENVCKDGRRVWMVWTNRAILNEQGEQEILAVGSDYTEQKRAEEALKKSQSSLAAAVQIARLGIWEYDLSTGLTHMDQRCRELFGIVEERPVSDDEFLGMVHPEDRARVERGMRAAHDPQGSGLYESDYRIIRADGTLCWVAVRAHAMMYGDGRGSTPKRYIGTVMDITALKRNEAALLENERRLRLSLESAYVISFEWNIASGKVFRLISKDPALPPTPVAAGSFEQVVDVIHPDDRDRFQSNLKAAMAQTDGRYENEFRIVHPDGTIRWLHENGYFERDAAGRPSRLIGLSRDITDRRDAENALRKSTERFELLAIVAERLLRAEDPQAIVEELCRLVMAHLDCQFFFNYLVAPDGQRLELNACAGIPAEAAALIRHLDFGVAVCGCVARAGRRIIAENIAQTEDPRTELVKSYGVQAYCCHPLMAQERLIGTLSFGTRTRPKFTPDEIALMKSVCDQVSVAMQRLQADKLLRDLNASLEQRVTERTALAESRAKQLQALAAELIEAEERERQRFARLLHEDLQQLLAGAFYMLQASPGEKLEFEQVGHLLEESIRKSRSLSHQLSPAVLHHATFLDSLEWLCRQMQEQSGLHVRLEKRTAIEVESAPLKVFLFRAVRELLLNVDKHAGVKSAGVEVAGRDDQVVITVNDSGNGFDPTIMEHYIPKAGLGLPSLRERASYLGGGLSIASAPGQGSRITLSVPVALRTGAQSVRADAVPADKVRTPAHTREGSSETGIRILFADDHKVMRQGLIRIVESVPGIQVVGEAADGREALELAVRHRPDIVVMDISMPVMDGIEATRRLKTELPDIRVIGLSMFDDEQASRQMLAAGADAFLVKTASAAELLNVISEVNTKSRPSPPTSEQGCSPP